MGCRRSILRKHSILLEAAVIATVMSILIGSIGMRFEVELYFLSSHLESMLRLVTKVLKSLVHLILGRRRYVVM